MLGLALPFSISTSMPLLTPARRDSSSCDSFGFSLLFDAVRHRFADGLHVGAELGRSVDFFAHRSIS